MRKDDDFYKKEFFNLLDERFNKTDAKIDALTKDVNDLKDKLRFIYGWAAGIGVAASVIWSLLKDKLSKLV